MKSRPGKAQVTVNAIVPNEGHDVDVVDNRAPLLIHDSLQFPRLLRLLRRLSACRGRRLSLGTRGRHRRLQHLLARQDDVRDCRLIRLLEPAGDFRVGPLGPLRLDLGDVHRFLTLLLERVLGDPTGGAYRIRLLVVVEAGVEGKIEETLG